MSGGWSMLQTRKWLMVCNKNPVVWLHTCNINKAVTSWMTLQGCGRQMHMLSQLYQMHQPVIHLVMLISHTMQAVAVCSLGSIATRESYDEGCYLQVTRLQIQRLHSQVQRMSAQLPRWQTS